MVKKKKEKIYKYLSEDKKDYLEQRKKLKEKRKEELEYKQEKKLEKSESFFGQIKTSIKKDIRNIPISKKPLRIAPSSIKIAPSLSNEQSMLQSMFGHGDRVIMPGEDTESLPQINGALIPSVINGDELDQDNVSDSFGFGIQRHRTMEFFLT